jgi:diguanylate cyclase (GGDEF)-like protein
MSRIAIDKNCIPLTKQRDFAVRLMEHLVIPTFVLDPQGKIIIWNRACERLTGIPASDMLGTMRHWAAFYEYPRECLADFIVQGRTDEISAFYVSNHDPEVARLGYVAENWCYLPAVGKRLFLAIDSGPIYDDEGNLIAVVETVRDMTDYREAHDLLETLANRDGLTELVNRRGFDVALEQNWAHCLREQRPLSLLMLDVDYFKHYNDAWGHQQGDECLRQVARVLAHGLVRSNDIVARYGGEEFAVILPTVDDAEQVARRLCTAIEQRKLPHPDSPVSDYVTISIGVGTLLPSLESDSTKLLALADRALYEAKHAGRNRVVALTGCRA